MFDNAWIALSVYDWVFGSHFIDWIIRIDPYACRSGEPPKDLTFVRKHTCCKSIRVWKIDFTDGLIYQINLKAAIGSVIDIVRRIAR
jgi:hypothetical protein